MATKLWIGTDSGNEGNAGTAANWSPSGVPGNSDHVVFDGSVSTQSVTAGLDQSAYTYLSLTVYDSFTGYIGTASAPYQAGATVCTLHKPSGISNANGSGRINLDFGSVQTACRVHGSASSAVDAGMPAIRVIGTHASNEIFISGGATVGIAAGDDSESATFATIVVNPNAQGRSPTVTLGEGCTLTDIDVSSGSVINRGANVSTLTMQGGTYTVYGDATHSTIEAHGGTVNYNSDGTLSNLLVGNSGSADFSGDGRDKTVTNITMQSGGSLNLNNGSVLSITVTNGIDMTNCSVQDVSIETWRDINISLGSV
jgi:hypothetical protein